MRLRKLTTQCFTLLCFIWGMAKSDAANYEAFAGEPFAYQLEVKGSTPGLILVTSASGRIDWGDGTSVSITKPIQLFEKTFAKPGVYRINAMANWRGQTLTLLVSGHYEQEDVVVVRSRQVFEDEWVILFQGSDPSKWGLTSGTPGIGEWSLGPECLPTNVDQLRLTKVEGGESLIIPMSASGVFSCGDVGGGWCWDGTGTFGFNARHVCITTAVEFDRSQTGYVTSWSCNVDRLTWGFGHRAYLDDRQGWGWNSLDLGPTVFQIAVRTPREPQIVKQPEDRVGYWGAEVSFFVAATGAAPMSFQWYKDGELIPGATNSINGMLSSITLTNLNLSMQGEYSARLSNSRGGIETRKARLTVNPVGMSIGLYAGLMIEGVVGKKYQIEHTDSVDSMVWTPATTITLEVPSQLWVDTSVSVKGEPKRYYRARPID